MRDNEQLQLDETILTARWTPGHTRGCTTWTCRVPDIENQRNVVIIGSPNVNPGFQLVDNQDYSEIAEHFAATFEVLKRLPCDVFLGAHGAYYGMLAKYQRFQAGSSENPFIDPEGYRHYVTQKEKAFLAELAAQRKAAGGTSP